MDIADTKLAVVKFISPVDINSPEFNYWIPCEVTESNLEIKHIALWKRWSGANSHIGTFILFISEEDASYLLLRYPDTMNSSIYSWPPSLTDKIFTDLDKYY